ncbi:FAD:protein FMN transferase [Jiulongibacter sediminis]|uniref:FAD:protein FMN transferase n=1 Tax=Jiulongibacter sediminis TaxID=1605367 RepID=A0A0P7C7E6_9BACT|nr:FAD:protein FMN transferase [Jiulongibacter sediminis]KPM49442.1 thiamine biosynthesis protein ApbE [Jiulongibacter sediminis]TBX26491.1 thiamine biosynthesis protein ApbE [Jiulongibacter sediminis]
MNKPQNFRKVEKLMGNRFELCIVHENETIAEQLLNDAVTEIQRIEALLSTFKDDSQVNQINQQAGIRPVKVDAEVFDLIARSNRISQLTDGAFDISYGGIDKSLWNFDTTMTCLPTEEIARQSVHLINFNNIELNDTEKSVFLKNKGMRIGFGGIGKGYGADKARQLLVNKGVKSGFINASGDLTAWGRQLDGKSWSIGLSDPDGPENYLAHLNISDAAIATSGTYEKFVIINGMRYSHTINPKTGFPTSGIKSVSILTTNAELADAMATPVMVMGVKSGLELINQMNLMECIIIDDFNTIHTSDGLKIS